MEVRIGKTRIESLMGDITALEVDAIVNAANNHFWMGSGVAGAIKKAGGGNIETEAMSRGPVEVGEVVVTGAGTLPSRWVIHAAVMGQDLVTSAWAIRDATRNTLRSARDIGAASVAFPAFGTGVGGFPPAEAAKAMVGAVAGFLAAGPGPERIVFALFSEDLRRAFDDELSTLSGG